MFSEIVCARSILHWVGGVIISPYNIKNPPIRCVLTGVWLFLRWCGWALGVADHPFEDCEKDDARKKYCKWEPPLDVRQQKLWPVERQAQGSPQHLTGEKQSKSTNIDDALAPIGADTRQADD